MGTGSWSPGPRPSLEGLAMLHEILDTTSYWLEPIPAPIPLWSLYYGLVLKLSPRTQLQGPTFEALIWTPPTAEMCPSSRLWSTIDLDGRSSRCQLFSPMHSSSQNTLCFCLEGSLPSFSIWPHFFPCTQWIILFSSRMGKEETKHVGSGQDVPLTNLSCQQDPVQTPQASKASHPFCHQRANRAQSTVSLFSPFFKNYF